jgi:hypothetical protein
MDQFVGLDVSQEMTHLCAVGGAGVWQGKCLSTPEDIAGTIRSKAPDVQRIGPESDPLSTWHWHALKAMGLPVVEASRSDNRFHDNTSRLYLDCSDLGSRRVFCHLARDNKK